MPIDLSNPIERKKFEFEIADKIDAYCKKTYTGELRSHMGASKIGNPCAREIWLSFRWVMQPDVSGRMGRIFDRGHREEARFIEWLRGAGFQFQSHDVDGKQFKISDCDGHFGGSCDGFVQFAELHDEVFLAEFKTSKDGTDFKMLFENRVAKVKPVHYAQMCVYGVKFGIKRALYLCINKNNDDIYREIVDLDWEYGNKLIAKAKDLIFNQEPPPLLSLNPSFYTCKNCDFYKICHGKEAALINCRSCRKCSPGEDASWNCGHWGCAVPKENIIQGCDAWESILVEQV